MKRIPLCTSLALICAMCGAAGDQKPTVVEPKPDPMVTRESHQPRPIGDDRVMALAQLAWQSTRDPVPERRAAAIKQMATFGDEIQRASAVLTAVGRNDPDPRIRQLAQQSIMQLKLEASNQERIEQVRRLEPSVSPRVHDNRPYRDALAEVLRINGPFNPALTVEVATALPKGKSEAASTTSESTTPSAEEPSKPAPATEQSEIKIAEPMPHLLPITEPKTLSAPQSATQQELVDRVEAGRKMAPDSLPRVDDFTDQKTREKIARDWLERGRTAVREGRIEDAQGALDFVKMINVRFSVWEYSPKSLEREISRAKSRR
jgi:hypothetical protein